MKNYILTLIGTALLASMVNMVSPEQWRKYIKLITGIVVISVLIAPLGKIMNVDIFQDFTIETAGLDENIQKKAVSEELKKRVEQDMEERIQKEFFAECSCSVALRVNENFEIEGIDRIQITGFGGDKGALSNRLANIYGIQRDKVEFAS